jgi:hypothetical protein
MDAKWRLIVAIAALAATPVVLLLGSIVWMALYALGAVEFSYPVGG